VHDEVVLENYVNAISQTQFVGNCLYYISGFIARTSASSPSFEDCILALYDYILDTPDPVMCSLVHRKNKGGPKFVSDSVYRIEAISVAKHYQVMLYVFLAGWQKT
jgi:hypothetical protein